MKVLSVVARGMAIINQNRKKVKKKTESGIASGAFKGVDKDLFLQ